MKYIITENQFDRILSDENISYINKTTTRLFNPIYHEIQDIVITKMKILGDPPLPKIYNVYVYVNNQLDKSRELEIARTIYSFIEDNFFIKVRNIEFDSEDFLYDGNPIRINSHSGISGKIFEKWEYSLSGINGLRWGYNIPNTPEREYLRI